MAAQDITGLIGLESELGLAEEYELAGAVALWLLLAGHDTPYVRASLAADIAAADVGWRWLARTDWPGAAETARLSRRNLGLFCRVAHSFERAPLWDGAALAGRTILVKHAFGYGDLLLRLRHVRELVERFGARVVLEVAAPLARLVRTSPYVASVVAPIVPPAVARDDRRDLAGVALDCWVPSFDLPVFLDCRHDAPMWGPYLTVERGLIDRWRRRLGPGDGRLRVGLVWAADVSHEWGRTRSMHLSELAPLARVPGVRWFSLQKTGSIRRAWTRPVDGGPEEEPAPSGLGLTRLGPQLDDFADTAGALSALDLLITVDTSVANLAGGLSLPNWVLLPTGAPAAVWGADGERCAAYPSAALFRQRTPGDWAPVVARVAEALRQLVAERRSAA